MERNQAVGLFLISALLLVYMFFFSPKPDEKAQQAKTQTTTSSTPATVRAADALLDSAAMAQQKVALGSFGNAAVGTAQKVLLENENLKVTFTSKGGAV